MIHQVKSWKKGLRMTENIAHSPILDEEATARAEFSDLLEVLTMSADTRVAIAEAVFSILPVVVEGTIDLGAPPATE